MVGLYLRIDTVVLMEGRTPGSSSAEERLPRHPSGAGRLAQIAIIALMAVGSLSLWIANPLLWLWLTSSLQSGTQPSMGPYAVLLLGLILTAVAIAKGLAALNGLYGRVTGNEPTIRIVLPWRRSIRGGRSQRRETDGRLPVSVLDVVMVISVALAVASFSTWYFVTSPTPPSAGGVGPAKH